jgi:glycosyltransferase involved in cell wall biosynthesis
MIVKARVLQLIPSFHHGGSERQAVQLTRLLKAEGSFEVRTACLDGSGVLRVEAGDIAGGDIPEFPLTSFYDVNFARQLRRFCALLKRERIQIIQTHDFYTNIFGMAAARIAGIPVRIAAKRETEMRTRAQAFIERRAFGPANVVAVNSRRVRDFLKDAGINIGKIEVVYNGIDPTRFENRPVDRTRLLADLGISSKPGGRLVTIVANVQDPVKNHEMLLRSASAVASQYADTAFVIAGEGERLEMLKGLAQILGLNGRTLFLGSCRRIPELLSLSEICVLTSRSEGFSNSILEYMAAGKPVVATDVGGASEAIVEGETGYLVPSDDDTALADRIGLLLADPELARNMGDAGRRRVELEFSTEKQLERTLSIYDRELRRTTGRNNGHR